MHRTFSFDPVDLVRDWVGPGIPEDDIIDALDRTHGTEEKRVKEAALELLLTAQATAVGAEVDVIARKVRALQDDVGAAPLSVVGNRGTPLAVDEYVG